MATVNTINANGDWYEIEDETARANITNVEQTVNSATTIANNALNAANSAQSAADSAASAASAAQSTANSAQTAANNASSAASTAQSTADSKLSKYSTSNTSDITFLCPGYLTSSKGALHFMLPIGTAFFGNIDSIVFDNLVIRQNGNYAWGGSDGSYYDPDTSGITISQNAYQTHIVINLDFSIFDFTNNDCLFVTAKLQIKYK